MSSSAARRQRRRHRTTRLQTVPGVLLNGAPFGYVAEEPCRICEAGDVPGWSLYEAAVECVTLAAVEAGFDPSEVVVTIHPDGFVRDHDRQNDEGTPLAGGAPSRPTPECSGSSRDRHHRTH